MTDAAPVLYSRPPCEPGPRSAILSEFLIILALIVANGIFAGTEIAVLSLRKTRLRELVENGSARARSVETLRTHPERFLATVQIGITVIGASAAAFGGATIANELAVPLRDMGLGKHAGAFAFAIVVAIVSYLSLVLGELVPKSLALRYAEGYAMTVARPILGLAWLMRPLVWFLTASSNVILRVFSDRTNFTESRVSPDELQQMVEEAAKSGTLDPRAGAIASRAFDFGKLSVDQVMIPRTSMVCLRRHAPADEVKRVLLEEGHSRMPVYEGSVDTIVGYVIAKDVLALSFENMLLVLEDIMRPAYFVPETMRAVDVLAEMQKRRVQLAIVVDEDGSTAGLVTIEDLVEEVVGDILSEYEVPEELVKKEASGSVIVQGTAQVRDVNRELGIDLPEGGDYTTIAGLAIVLAGWIPQPGQKLEAPDGTVLEIVDASPRRVRAVRITRGKKVPEGPSEPPTKAKELSS